MYLMGSLWAESKLGTAKNDAQRKTRRMQRLEILRIRCAGESVCLYRLRRGEVNGPSCLFRRASRKGKGALFTARAAASSMQGNQHATLRRASQSEHDRRFSRETGRRDLRRATGHPASLWLPAKGGTGGPLTTHPDATLPDS